VYGLPEYFNGVNKAVFSEVSVIASNFSGVDLLKSVLLPQLQLIQAFLNSQFATLRYFVPLDKLLLNVNQTLVSILTAI